jgi:hypothetical protein
MTRAPAAAAKSTRNAAGKPPEIRIDPSGVSTFLHSGASKAYGAAKGQGHRINGLFGDLTQLGGLLVVKPPASLAYLYKSRFAGDHPNLSEALAVL